LFNQEKKREIQQQQVDCFHCYHCKMATTRAGRSSTPQERNNCRVTIPAPDLDSEAAEAAQETVVADDTINNTSDVLLIEDTTTELYIPQ
jgi:hypothetical protein